MRKLIKSVLLRDMPRSTPSRPMLRGLLRRTGTCKENAQCEAERAEQRAQLLAIHEELKRVRAAKAAAMEERK